MKFAKHIHVLHLLSTIPAPCTDTTIPLKERITKVMSEVEAVAAWDHIFEYIHANWAAPDSAWIGHSSWAELDANRTAQTQLDISQCQSMLRMPREEFEGKLETLPPYFTEFIFPVSVARYLFREMAIPMNHRKSTTFKEFHIRYGYIILSD